MYGHASALMPEPNPTARVIHMPNDAEDAPSLAAGQAAKRLGVSMATLRRWTNSGALGCYRTPGYQRRYSERQLRAFLEAARRDPNERKQ